MENFVHLSSGVQCNTQTNKKIRKSEMRVEERDKMAERDKGSSASTLQTRPVDAQKRFGQTSRMKREFHIRFCEGLRAKSPWATRQSANANVHGANKVSL